MKPEIVARVLGTTGLQTLYWYDIVRFGPRPARLYLWASPKRPHTNGVSLVPYKLMIIPKSNRCGTLVASQHGATTEEQTVAPKPQIAVAVCLLKGKCILMGRRLVTVANSKFSIPSGHLEFGENFEECAAREMKEETGLEIKKIEFLKVTNNVYMEGKTASHYVSIFVRAEMADPEQKPENLEPEKCEGWEWYPWDNLPNPLAGPIKKMIEDGFNPFPDAPH